ncbi:MaoC/PaaZ C-terminal domain-containing protein [Priestia endophytica]|uniref:MaoC/PaaZ C-terminal domain-containing protein n=1 Tax=Priestia endophytica TaxID=135735 RepID=UPI000F527373|nr:MaoC/PaaZ C-terminal domain-containing protein [Priestia endophytica]RPK15165.1 hypothetical protein FH5_00600 [Priestia endophytica]
MKTYTIFVSEEDINNYAKVSSDYNPIHMNKEEAKKYGFKDRIGHGMLSMGKVMAALSSSIPKRSYVKQYNMTFLSPLYIGQSISLTVEEKGETLHVKGVCEGENIVKGKISFSSL